MLAGARIAVIVPAFNVEDWIEGTLRSVPEYVDRIVVVDDASTDGTAARALAVADLRVSLHSHPENRGVGAAIVSGYLHAASDSDILVVMAGDGQMHPDDLPQLILPVARGEADYCKGERLSHPAVWKRMPWRRLLGTAVLGWLTARAAGLERIRDGQCGFTAIAARVLPRLQLERLWPRYGYPNDLLGALANQGLRVAEVPVQPIYRGEPSGLRPSHLPTMVYLIARVAWRRWISREKPRLQRDAPPLPRA